MCKLVEGRGDADFVIMNRNPSKSIEIRALKALLSYSHKTVRARIKTAHAFFRDLKFFMLKYIKMLMNDVHYQEEIL